MSREDRRQELVLRLADLDENGVLALVAERLTEEGDPLEIIEDCRQGMVQVGERYEQQQYYLSGLIMAGEIFREVMELVQSHLRPVVTGDVVGRVLLGTVRGDIHDIGKNIFHMLLRCYGFNVEDLGVDVPPERFVEGVKVESPDVVGLSALLTASFDSMQETVQLLKAEVHPESQPVPVIIGGLVDEQVCRYVGADFWTTDALQGVRLCERLVKRK